MGMVWGLVASVAGCGQVDDPTLSADPDPRFDESAPEPALRQERAVTSAIWYAP